MALAMGETHSHYVESASRIMAGNVQTDVIMSPKDAMTTRFPKVFLSYSWTSPDHEAWVLDLATQLRENGIDAILDKWDLKEGHDAYAFMERMVTDAKITKVIIICDKKYSEKADKRTGGVGSEAQIITPKLYKKSQQDKFVALVREKDDRGNLYVPAFLTSRIHIDISSDDLYSTAFDQLLRWIYDKPLYVKPKLGHTPAFLSGSAENIILGTSSRHRRALDSVRNSKNDARGALSDYFEILVAEIETLCVTQPEKEADDQFIERIEQFIPYRNEAIEIFVAIARYDSIPQSHVLVHRFFESLLQTVLRAKADSKYDQIGVQILSFIAHELFLYANASYLKYECFESAAHLLRTHYYVVDRGNLQPTKSFQGFRDHLPILQKRNERLNLRRIALRSDLLEQRSKSARFDFRDIMQADFVMYIRDCMSAIRNDTRQTWWPETLLYTEINPYYVITFEIFSKAISKLYFDRMKVLFDAQEKSDFGKIVTAISENAIRVPRWEYESFDPIKIMGYKQLSTQP